MTITDFALRGNTDDMDAAIDGLSQFCHSFCMNCAETKAQNDLVFRCGECPFKDKATNKCAVKMFLHKFGTKEQFNNSTAMGAL